MLERILYSSLLKINPKKRKVYDCFPFFNELELLELRLKELFDYVDRFVIVEATKTHQNNPKPLYFMENRDRFKQYQDKIIHIIVDDLPGGSDAMVNEKIQRNRIHHALSECRWYDVVIVSDLDEIPNPVAIDYYKKNSMLGLRRLDQKLFYYFLNNLTNHNWRQGYISSYGRLKRQDLSGIRVGKAAKNKLLLNGGWHFSWLGGADIIIQKIEAMGHNEYNVAQYKEQNRVIEYINKGKDLFDRDNIKFTLVEIDETFPRQVIEHIDYYKKIGWIKE